MGLMIPKLLPLKLAKILIKTGIFNLLCRRYLKMCGTSVKEALDEISDNKEFKGVLCYIFGDLGRYILFIPLTPIYAQITFFSLPVICDTLESYCCHF